MVTDFLKEGGKRIIEATGFAPAASIFGDFSSIGFQYFTEGEQVPEESPKPGYFVIY